MRVSDTYSLKHAETYYNGIILILSSSLMSWFLDFYFICACSPRNFSCVFWSVRWLKNKETLYIMRRCITKKITRIFLVFTFERIVIWYSRDISICFVYELVTLTTHEKTFLLRYRGCEIYVNNIFMLLNINIVICSSTENGKSGSNLRNFRAN